MISNSPPAIEMQSKLLSVINWAESSVAVQQAALARAAQTSSLDLQQQVTHLINQVRDKGDQALIEMAQTFDGVDLTQLKVSETALAQASDQISDELKAAIQQAKSNIAAFHQAQLRTQTPIKVSTMIGVDCELRSEPIAKVGLYIPAGSAPLISTVLMLAVPAQLAGCEQCVLITPPNIDPAILYAANLCGITEVYQSGGAGAIAALALGTQTIPKVDKIFGPGNAYVTEAKKQLSQDPQAKISIDMPAGPSEVLVIADQHANAEFIAADLLSQAEHGADSQAILICTNIEKIQQVEQALAQQLAQLPRQAIARAALSHSRAILVGSLAQAVAVSNQYAPEHLIVQVEQPHSLLAQLRNAGSIFLGAYTPEAVGDYASGTNHVLPTYGYASTVSSLSLADFRRRFTVQSVSAEGLNQLANSVMTLAQAEQLEAHSQAVAIRLQARESQLVSDEIATDEIATDEPSAQFVHHVLRPELAHVQPYESARRIFNGEQHKQTRWLNANESPFNNTDCPQANRYPEPQPETLVQRYAAYAGVSPAQVMVCRGADEAIELLIRTFCVPNQDSISIFSPTYGMYAISAEGNGIAVNDLPLNADFSLPESLLNRQESSIQQSKLIFICNPNNPTGTTYDIEQLCQLCALYPAQLIVVDEAYIEFAVAANKAQSMSQYLAKYPNLVVLRTLSKAFALAGMRCGFLLASPQICQAVNKVIAPYPIAQPVIAYVEQALSAQGITLMQQQVAQLNQAGLALANCLTQLKIRYAPFAGNFLLAQFEQQQQYQQVLEALVSQQFITRQYRHPRLANCIRFSFDDQVQTERLIHLLQQSLK